jgi:ATP-binding cassette subfamily C protein CydC
MGLAGWLIVRSAQTGLSATSTFSWIYPSAGGEALAVVRTAARYGERLTTHRATLEILARLRARVFASVTGMTPRQLRRFRSGDLLDRVQADIDSLDRVVLTVAVPGVVCAIVGAAGLAVRACPAGVRGVRGGGRAGRRGRARWSPAFPRGARAGGRRLGAGRDRDPSSPERWPWPC